MLGKNPDGSQKPLVPLRHFVTDYRFSNCFERAGNARRRIGTHRIHLAAPSLWRILKPRRNFVPFGLRDDVAGLGRLFGELFSFAARFFERFQVSFRVPGFCPWPVVICSR